MRIWNLLLIILVCGCGGKSPDVHQEHLAAHYVVKSYYSNAHDPKNLNAIKYYDSSDRLLCEIGKEGDCTNYIYDADGKLLEKVWGRSCEQVQGEIRSILIYDSLNHHVGTYTTSADMVNLDTVRYKQAYFYDIENRLVKEKIAERIEPSGDTINTWHHYTYDGSRKDSVVIRENDGLLWEGAYRYNAGGKMVELLKTRINKFENEYFIYDNSGRLVEKRTETNESVASPVGVVKVPDSKVVYTYDSTGFLIKEVLYHDGKAIVQEVNIREF